MEESVLGGSMYCCSLYTIHCRNTCKTNTNPQSMNASVYNKSDEEIPSVQRLLAVVCNFRLACQKPMKCSSPSNRVAKK